MTFVPIIERELRVRARRRATYWTRFAVGAFGALMCLMQLEFGGAFGGAASAGQYAFHGLVMAAFLLCCGACGLTADAISSERREGTLGLLFLTRVQGHDVLLGKLGAAALAGLCALIAFLPVLMIPILSGGVTGGEAFRKGLVLLDTLFVGLAAGLWASAQGEVWLAALRKAVLLMLGILIGPIIVGFLARLLAFGSQAAAAFSPITGLLSASDVSFRVAPGQYWESLVLIHLLGWLLLWRASVLVRRSLHEAPAATSEPQEVPAPTGTVPAPGRRREALTDQIEPIRWLLNRQRGLWLAVWAGALLALSHRLFYPFLFRFVGTGAARQAVVWPLSMFAGLAMVALFAWVASRFFVESRRSGELELLLTTPRGAATVVSAQWEMLKHLFRWPIALLVLMSLLQAAPLLWQWYVGAAGPWPTGAWRVHYAVALGIGCVNLCLSVLALCWTGMWFGLTARNQISAIVWTVGLVTCAPNFVAWCLNFFASSLIRLGPNTWFSIFHVILSWLSNLIVLFYYLWLIRRARRLLSGDLRDAELQPLGLIKGVREFWLAGATAMRKARHWTPS